MVPKGGPSRDRNPVSGVDLPVLLRSLTVLLTCGSAEEPVDLVRG